MKLFTVTFIIFFALFHRISSDAVCSEDELIRELKEDIADNGSF